MTDVLATPLRIVNVGLELFAAELATAGVPVIHVDWRPPAGGPQVATLLARLEV
jgi:FdrA protein